MPPLNRNIRIEAWIVAMVILGAGVSTPYAVADITFSATGITLNLTADGKVSALLDTVAGRDRNIPSPPYTIRHLCKITVSGVTHIPTGFSFAANRLTYTFPDLNPTVSVTILVEEKPGYLVFTLESVIPQTGIDDVCFVNLRTRNAKECGNSSLLFFDDDTDGNNDRILGIYALNIFTRMWGGLSQTGGYLRASAYPGLPHPNPVTLAGQQAVLFTAAATDTSVFDVLGQIDNDYDLPIDATTNQLPALRRSSFFWMKFACDEKELALQYTQEAGASRIVLLRGLWGDHLRGYRADTTIWGSSAELRNWVAQCRDAGVVVGAHLFPGLISVDSIDYIRAGCDPRIYRDRAVTLAAELPASQTTGLIQTTTPPMEWSVDAHHRDLVIEGEIIEYTGIQTAHAPYGFTGPFVRAKNQTGDGGLGPRAHATGAAIEHLVSSPWGRHYQWGIASGGVEQWCTDIAARLDAADIRVVYLDGASWIQGPVWHSLGYLTHTLYQAMQDTPLWFECSDIIHNLDWPLVAISGQIDYHVLENQFKSEVDRNVNRMLTVSGFTRRQLGWSRLGDSAFQSTPDELEYLLAKSVAYDAPVVFHVWMSALRTWPHRSANFYMMSRYEQLRLSNHFPEPVKVTARQPSKDFMLFTDSAGDPHLVPTSRLNIASWSTAVRGFITDQKVNGNHYVTLWPTTLDAELNLLLDGVNVNNVVAGNYRGDPLSVANIGGGQIAIPVTTRIYIRLVDVPDPTRIFSRATISLVP